MPSFDFDQSDSNLNVGIEVEYPIRRAEDQLYVHRGRESNTLQDNINGNWPTQIGGRATYDGTVGLEVVSDVLNVDDAPQWYRDTLDYIVDEYGRAYQPTGLMRGGSTAGMHIHISNLSEEKARRLQEISETPWAKVMFCSSIANDGGTATWPVFRGGRYCRMGFSNGRYDCVNRRAPGHYEWRLPEPVAPEHIDLVMDFLAIFGDSPENAVEFVQELLDDGDDRITSIKRAEAVGMDIEEMPVVEREPAPDDPEGFFEHVNEAWDLPDIYHVRFGGESFYTFETQYESSVSLSAHPVEIGDDMILRADTLQTVTDPGIADDISRAFNQRRSNEERHTEATDELKKVLKKKKGKS